MSKKYHPEIVLFITTVCTCLNDMSWCGLISHDEGQMYSNKNVLLSSLDDFHKRSIYAREKCDRS